MELDQNEVRRGTQWFFGAGLFALALSVFIYQLDLGLERSTYDQDNARNIRELRKAAANVAGDDVRKDPRLRVEFSSQPVAILNSEAKR